MRSRFSFAQDGRVACRRPPASAGLASHVGRGRRGDGRRAPANRRPRPRGGSVAGTRRADGLTGGGGSADGSGSGTHGGSAPGRFGAGSGSRHRVPESPGTQCLPGSSVSIPVFFLTSLGAAIQCRIPARSAVRVHAQESATRHYSRCGRRCCSSVVEHVLGKDGAVGSIPTSSYVGAGDRRRCLVLRVEKGSRGRRERLLYRTTGASGRT